MKVLTALGMVGEKQECYLPDEMAKLRLVLLGGFEARTDSGLSLAMSGKKAQMLLAYLAMHQTQTHLRDKLATLLWGDAPAEQARLSLRQALFIIRQALPFDPTLVEGDGVAFAADTVTVDVSDFEQLARSHDPDELGRAAALYQADLPEGISPGSAQFEEWLRAERERLHELALEAFAKLLGHQMKLGATEPAIQTALRLLSLDPLQEITHRALMRLYAAKGRRAAALRQYQVCVDILQRELGIEPEEATKQVYRELLPQSPHRAVAAQAAEPRPLPQRRRRRLRAHRRSPPLIGRDVEVDRLTQALAKACAGHGHVMALLGEAGIGKTRLITALRQAAIRRGAQVLIGQSYETERLLPFGPWVQAMREAGIVESRALEGLGAGWIADLSYLFPELRHPEWPLPSEPIEALRLFDAMTELVKSLATRHPLVLVLEDLHWAHEMSVRLFSFLGRRLDGLRILLVGTAREEELDAASPVRRMLAELSKEEPLVRLSLAPLSREQTQILVRRIAEGRADDSSLTHLEDRVWTLSEGNPFVIVESLREALDTARGPSLPDLPAVPEKVRELILGRFERLSDAAQHLLATAAVIGRDFEFRLLQRGADVGEAEAASALEALVRAHILHSIGERFDFTHDRVREVAYDRLLPARRRLLHARVVAALEEGPAVPDAIGTIQQDRLREHVEQLAYHAVRGELREKADHFAAEAIARSSRFRPTMLAVLPFQNLSGDSAQDYFADGLAEEMITRLGELGGSQLGVVARTSCMVYKKTTKDIGQIGRELEVDYILEGSVRRDGNQVRITVQLIRVQNQTHMWANTYDRELTYSIGVQEEVAREVAQRIRVSLASAGALPVPLNPLANDAYLQGRYFCNQYTADGFGKAAFHFERAVAADPKFAAAWAGIAESHTFLIIHNVLRPQEGWPKVRHAAQKAIELDPTLSDGRMNLAHFEMHMWNWKPAEPNIQKAIALNPSNEKAHRWYAVYLSALGRHQEAIREINRSRDLDPFSVIANAEIVRTLYYARRWKQAAEEAHKVELLDPDYPRTHFWLGRVYAQMGKFSEAIAEAERSGPTDSLICLTELAYARARAGDTADANALLQNLQQRAERAYVPAYDFAIIYTALGKNEQALGWLKKAYNEHGWPLCVLAVEPRLDPLRSDSRFQSLLSKVGLKQP
jgi:TolB-like protein/DNA-binding SARP family transcriptional activator/Tfp pilus assembly protein PilF